MTPEVSYGQRQQRSAELIRLAGMVITQEEEARIEIADFGLGRFEETGLGILVYVNNARYCAKELVMWPQQTCPEHLHPLIGTDHGKQETFRCRWGSVYLYVEGEASSQPHCRPPKGREGCFTAWHEIKLDPGEQHTILPGTKHWFQAGPAGAVISEFSTRSRDESDLFTDPDIRRATQIG